MEASSTIWIVEDEPAAGELAADLCRASGVEPTVFRSPVPFLRAFGEAPPPRAIVLDWRLEHELSAAIFLATRHRFPELPVVFWTGNDPSILPSVIHQDPNTLIIDKAAGTDAFEKALDWAGQRGSRLNGSEPGVTDAPPQAAQPS